MKANQVNGIGVGASFKSVKNACAAACQKVLAQIKSVKESIFAESFKALQSEDHLLRLALNEAEAAAFQTKYPHLVFPTLAMEKTQEVIQWHRQQQVVQPANRALAWAA
jgi:hypothetical protein